MGQLKVGDCRITRHAGRPSMQLQSEVQVPSCPLSVGWRGGEGKARHASMAYECSREAAVRGQHFPRVSDWHGQA